MDTNKSTQSTDNVRNLDEVRHREEKLAQERERFRFDLQQEGIGRNFGRGVQLMELLGEGMKFLIERADARWEKGNAHELAVLQASEAYATKKMELREKREDRFWETYNSFNRRSWRLSMKLLELGHGTLDNLVRALPLASLPLECLPVFEESAVANLKRTLSIAEQRNEDLEGQITDLKDQAKRTP